MAKANAAFQLGMHLDTAPRPGAPRNAQAEVSNDETARPDGAAAVTDPAADHFIVRDGVCFAGTHLIIDLWDARRLDDVAHIRQALIEAVEVAGATLLHIHLHRFTPNGGISGVAVLAESHISVHSWPERGFAAFDVFMCGDARPERVIPVLRRAFRPGRVELRELRRGETEERPGGEDGSP